MDSTDDSIESSTVLTSEDITDKLMGTDYTYPSPSDEDFQKKIYEKREFYYHKKAGRDELNEYKDIKEWRDKTCAGEFKLQEQQAMLSNFINPDTPYRGVLLFHGTGTGKCVSRKTVISFNDRCDTIENMWTNYKTTIVPDVTGGEWTKPKIPIFLCSINKNQLIVKKKVVRMFRQEINTFIRRITLIDGRSVEATLVHKFLTPNGWTNNIKRGDKIGVISQFGVQFIHMKGFEFITYSGFVYDLEIEQTHNFAVANGILCHNTCAGIAIAEKFKETVQKYNTKIYVLTSGPLIKESWKNELLKCTGETYVKQTELAGVVNEAERQRIKKEAINVALQYYRFMSYRSFYKKVLGEKIVEKVKTADDKVKAVYRKTKEGEFERDIAIDRIYNLNNSLIIVDEAHNLTGNAYGEALMKIIKNSHNLKIVLLTATPMKNLADDIVELINFLRPPKTPMMRDKIFTADKNHLMEFKPGGEEYFRKMIRGYVSYLRGADPLTFAKRVEKGTIPQGLLFTKTVSCKMRPFQRSVYDEVIRVQDDTLDRRSEAVANFAFPGLSSDHKNLEGLYGRKGLNTLKNQLKTNQDTINRKIASDIIGSETEGEREYVSITDDGITITGEILKFKNLKHFSVKFYKALKKINRLIWGKKGAKTAFIYSNLVKVGIELFTEILLVNGYLEYDEDPSNYKIKSDTICYFCGKTYKEHQSASHEKLMLGRQKDQDASESSTEYEKPKGEIPHHEFHPATFIPITGQSSEEAAEIITEDKKRILDQVFSNIENKEGKYIKFVLGSKVMSEAISLKNVAEVHILDVYYHLGKVDQVIGRAIRHCSHYNVMNERNPYPEVKVYKYAVSVDNGLSSEEDLYKKAEQKYILIKKTERIIKEEAIDCPLNRSGNIFPEELNQFKNCVPPGDTGNQMCPAICDYTDCNFKCANKKLNDEYYDATKNIYDRIPKNKLDYTTFTQSLAKNEIERIKSKIREMFKIKLVYNLQEIINNVKHSYDGEQKDLFDVFFVFKALDDMVPMTENDFNNFKDTLFDKFNRAGYLIHVNKYYIFQPFDQNEDVPMYYRSTYDHTLTHPPTLFTYLKHTKKFKDVPTEQETEEEEQEIIVPVYNFDIAMEYYDTRNEFKYVGIIDKESSRRRTKAGDELQDVFKIREKRSKILDKKRGTGIPSIKGAVCSTSKERDYLEKIAKEIKADIKNSNTRQSICEIIKERLLFLEKYSTDKKKNKMTYIIIPSNHSVYPFPYNLEDRTEYIKRKISDKIKFKIDLSIKENKRTIQNEDVTTYTIEIKSTPQLKDFDDFFKELGFSVEKGKYILNVE